MKLDFLKFNQKTIIRNDKLALFFLTVTPAVLGSLFSVLLIIISTWSAISMTFGRFKPRLEKSDWQVAAPALLYVFVNLAIGLYHDRSLNSMLLMSKDLMFLVPFLAIARYRASGNVDYFELFIRAIPYGGIIVLPLILYQAYVLGIRVEGGDGNAFPFASVCAVLGTISLLNLKYKLLRIEITLAGYLSFLLGVLLSDTRTFWAVIVIHLVLIVWFIVLSKEYRLRLPVLVSVLAGVLMIGFVVKAPIQSRYDNMVAEIEVIQSHKGGADTSIGQRIAMWKAGLNALNSAPIIGHGRQSRQDILYGVEYVEEVKNLNNGDAYSKLYTHFHNGFLNSIVDAGFLGLFVTVLVLMSPLMLAHAAPKDARRRDRWFIALTLLSTYFIVGNVNILFGHDIIDALFVFICTMLAISVCPKCATEKVVE